MTRLADYTHTYLLHRRWWCCTLLFTG